MKKKVKNKRYSSECDLKKYKNEKKSVNEMKEKLNCDVISERIIISPYKKAINLQPPLCHKPITPTRLKVPILHFTTHIQMGTLPQTQEQTIQDAWDYKGRPAERSKTGGWTSAAMILGLLHHSLPFLLLSHFPLFHYYNSIIT